MANGHRGSALWASNQIRSDFLPALLKDLKQVESDGWADEICQLVQEILQQLTSTETKIETAAPSITETWELFDEFREKYVFWNDKCETEECRQAKRQELKHLRDRIAEKFRRNTQDFSAPVIKNEVESIFEMAANMSVKHPEFFKNTSKSVGRFKTKSRKALSA